MDDHELQMESHSQSVISCLPYSDKYKYLGHVICADLTDDADVMKQTRSLYARAMSIIRKFSQASLASKIVLFKAYCTPMYGCQLWSSSFQFSLNKLKVAYNDGFRLLLNEPRWCSASSLFVYHKVPTFDALIRKLIYALWRSCHNSSNVLVDKLFASDIYFESKLFKRWHQLLY